MNQRIEQIYAQRPRRYIFELAVAAVVTGLLIWSGSAVETSGTTQNGAKIALNILYLSSFEVNGAGRAVSAD